MWGVTAESGWALGEVGEGWGDTRSHPVLKKVGCVDDLGHPRLQCRRCRRHKFHPWVGKIPWRRTWQPALLFLPGESHGQRSLVGYGPWSHKESDMTEGHSMYLPGQSLPSACPTTGTALNRSKQDQPAGWVPSLCPKSIPVQSPWSLPKTAISPSTA